MRLLRHSSGGPAGVPPAALAIGRFDGVHLGHQRVLDELRRAAAARRGGALVALRAARPDVAVLTSFRRRMILLRDAGVDAVALLARHDDAADVAIAQRFSAPVLVTGASGATAAGVDVVTVPWLTVAGEGVSTAGLHDLVAAGALDAARQRAGRWPEVDGRVVHGYQRGARLGIPTANLRVAHRVVPPDGVYAVRAVAAGASRCGVANIGFNPTFGNAVRTIETHLFDFDGDLYGQRIEVAFVRRMRAERRFPSVDALLAQIRDDIAAARRYLANELPDD